ncbi:MAG: hypothetical protein KAQ98_12480 [Bacteriovoracaceae bacterium]|nr:hypothetical protein [Bacteriovoracaceae bacterium]
MALDLNQIKESRKKLQFVSDDSKKCLTKPWELFEEAGDQLRTFTAQEAVKKARRIVKQNDEQVSRLRSNARQIEEEMFQEEDEFSMIDDRTSVSDDEYIFSKGFMGLISKILH